MRELHSRIAAGFEKHVGRGRSFKLAETASVACVSNDSIQRIKAGKNSKDFVQIVYRLATRFGRRCPQLIRDIVAPFTPGFDLVRTPEFSREELDANRNGKVPEMIDALIFQADGTEASANKGHAILRGETSERVTGFDLAIQESSAKASAVVKLMAGGK